jgi:hypothetical protein
MTMTTRLKLMRSAVAVSLLALATACGGGAFKNEQNTAPANIQPPAGEVGTEAMPTAATPSLPAAERSPDSAAPVAREVRVAPKAPPAQRPAQRNQATPRGAPKPTFPPTPTCPPEHREMDHC